MVKIFLLAVVLVSSQTAWPQGQFYFNNRIGTEVDARFITCQDLSASPGGSISSIGSPDWSVQILQRSLNGQLLPLVPSSTEFRGAPLTPTAGYVVGVTVTVPGVPIGGAADILLRILGPAGYSYDVGPYAVSGLGGAVIPPPNLQLGTTPIWLGSLDCPEPSILVLSVAGLAGMLCLFRRDTSLNTSAACTWLRNR